MFGKKNLNEEKNKIDKELALYRREQMIIINEQLTNARDALKNQWSFIEHEHHNARQIKNTEIAKLDALIEAKKEILIQDSNTCNFLMKVIENLSKMNVHNDVNIDSIKN